MIQDVLARTRQSLDQAKSNRAEQNRRREAAGGAAKDVNEQLSFSIYFANHFGRAITAALASEFGESDLASGEVGSRGAEGDKRVDVSYSTREGGLGLMVSLKSVHEGEKDGGTKRFTHNLKRNDEELRVEATGLHLRQPYAVLVATMILPFEVCEDAWPFRGGAPTSSFGRWVERLWGLRGRVEPEDPPNLFELVFVALYARDGSELGFYEVGGNVGCPRSGRPSSLLTFDDYIDRIKAAYYRRNRRDFSFEGELPLHGQPDE